MDSDLEVAEHMKYEFAKAIDFMRIHCNNNMDSHIDSMQRYFDGRLTRLRSRQRNMLSEHCWSPKQKKQQAESEISAVQDMQSRAILGQNTNKTDKVASTGLQAPTSLRQQQDQEQHGNMTQFQQQNNNNNNKNINNFSNSSSNNHFGIKAQLMMMMNSNHNNHNNLLQLNKMESSQQSPAPANSASQLSSFTNFPVLPAVPSASQNEYKRDISNTSYMRESGSCSSSALHDERNMLEEQNEALHEKLRLAEKRCKEAGEMARKLAEEAALKRESQNNTGIKDEKLKKLRNEIIKRASSGSDAGTKNAGDWQEELYQMIITMREKYLAELSEMYQKISVGVQQVNSSSQHPMRGHLEKFRMLKNMIERLLSFLQIKKQEIVPSVKDKLGPYEKQILNVLSQLRPYKQVSLPQNHMHPMQQQQSQSQPHVHDSQMHPQISTINLQSQSQPQVHDNQRHPQISTVNLQSQSQSQSQPQVHDNQMNPQIYTINLQSQSQPQVHGNQMHPQTFAINLQSQSESKSQPQVHDNQMHPQISTVNLQSQSESKSQPQVHGYQLHPQTSAINLQNPPHEQVTLPPTLLQIENLDWRTQLQPDSRQQLPFSFF